MRAKCPVPKPLHNILQCHICGKDGKVEATWAFTEADGTRGLLAESQSEEGVITLTLTDDGDGTESRWPCTVMLALTRSEAYDLAQHLLDFNDEPHL